MAGWKIAVAHKRQGSISIYQTNRARGSETTVCDSRNATSFSDVRKRRFTHRESAARVLGKALGPIPRWAARTGWLRKETHELVDVGWNLHADGNSSALAASTVTGYSRVQSPDDSSSVRSSAASCAACRYKFTDTTGTLLEKTRTPLSKWLLAIGHWKLGYSVAALQADL